MKNIWFINEYDLPPEFSKFRRRYDMCKYLLKIENYNLHIICGSFIHGSEGKYAYSNKKKYIFYNGIHVYILKGFAYGGIIKRVISMLSFFLKLIFFKFPKNSKPDLIYASSPHLFAALGALILAKKNKVKFILEVRDLWPETWVQMGIIRKGGIIHKFFLILEKTLYSNADKIVFLGSKFDYFFNVGISKDKMRYIGNGVDLEEFDKKIPFQNFLEKDFFNITYTGAIGVANNLDIILDLAKNIKDNKIRFNIIGYGPLKKHLEKRIIEEKIENVIFYPPIDKKLVPEVLRDSDVLIMAVLDIDLYKNGVSFNKLYEYWGSAKPILFYGNVVSNEIEETKSGIISYNINDFQESCLKLYNITQEEREKIGKNGRKYVEENFDWKILADKVDSVLEEVLGCKKEK